MNYCLLGTPNKYLIFIPLRVMGGIICSFLFLGVLKQIVVKPSGPWSAGRAGRTGGVRLEAWSIV